MFAYDAGTRTFIANNTKGRNLSSLDKLVKNPDGSTDIYIGPTVTKGRTGSKPSLELMSSWALDPVAEFSCYRA